GRMQLPGKLRGTSLGDLLAKLHGARANGTLELKDGDRTHRVYVSAGQVVAVEVDGSSTSLGDVLRSVKAVDDDVLRRSVLRAIASRRLLGDVLVRDFAVAPQVVGAALRRQIARRLEQLDRLQDARISFRVAIRPPPTALFDEPVGPEDFPSAKSGTYAVHDPRAEALTTLGLDPHDAANGDVIRRAYRRLAKSYHPDAHPHATDEERRELAGRFSALSEAYALLSA
ncbi:MAG: DUF4388 domain-containing protein, partial [Polyangiaceae bacterium]